MTRTDFAKLAERHRAERKAEREFITPERSRGLGDTIAKMIHKVSHGKIRPCGGCKERQQWLNDKIPYKEQ